MGSSFDVSTLPQEVRDKITVEDHGDYWLLFHPYVDQGLLIDVKQAVQKQGGTSWGWDSGRGAYRHKVPKPDEMLPSEAQDIETESVLSTAKLEQEKASIPPNESAEKIIKADLPPLEPATKDTILKVPLPSIAWNSPIRDFTQQDIINMATSLRVHGQIHPIVCKPQADGVYEGVCGRLRFEGAKHAHIPEVLVRVHKFERESAVKEWQLAENLHRKDLTALERAEAYKTLYDQSREERGGVHDKHIVTAIAESQEKLTGKKPSERDVWRYIQIANELPKEVKEKTANVGSFGVGHADQLLRLKTKPDKQIELAKEFVHSNIEGKPLTVKKLKKKVDQILSPTPPAPPEQAIDTGIIFTCPTCGWKATHIHISEKKHKLQEVK